MGSGVVASHYQSHGSSVGWSSIQKAMAPAATCDQAPTTREKQEKRDKKKERTEKQKDKKEKRKQEKEKNGSNKKK